MGVLFRSFWAKIPECVPVCPSVLSASSWCCIVCCEYQRFPAYLPPLSLPVVLGETAEVSVGGVSGVPPVPVPLTPPAAAG